MLVMCSQQGGLNLACIAQAVMSTTRLLHRKLAGDTTGVSLSVTTTSESIITLTQAACDIMTTIGTRYKPVLKTFHHFPTVVR